MSPMLKWDERSELIKTLAKQKSALKDSFVFFSFYRRRFISVPKRRLNFLSL